MIPYIVKSMKKPGTDEKKFYIQVAPTVPLTLEQIAKHISSRCTVTETDCLAVLNELETEVITAARNGNSVRLGKLGSFRPTISSAGVATAADVKISNVKAVRCRFNPGSRLRAALHLSNEAVRFIKRDSIVKDAAGGEDHA